MCTTTHLSDHVQDTWLQDNTSHKRFGALPWCHPGHQGTSVGLGQYPRYADARKGRPWAAQQHHNSTTRLRHLHDTAARLSNTFVVAQPVRWNRRCTKLCRCLTTRSSHESCPRAETFRKRQKVPQDSAGELREAPRQHVQSGHLHQKQDIKKLILVDLADHWCWLPSHRGHREGGTTPSWSWICPRTWNPPSRLTSPLKRLRKRRRPSTTLWGITTTKRRTLMKCTRNALYSYLVSKMKHIQKYYKVKVYIPRESANQNVAIVGERNDEDHTVPSVMKLTEKLTDEDVDEMILETDVDDTVLWADRGRTSSSDRRQNRGSCHSIPQERIPERVVVQIVNMSEHTHVDGGNRQRFSTSRSKLRTRSMRRLSQARIQQRTSEQAVNKHVQQVVNSVEVTQSEIIMTTVQRKNPIIHEKINHVSKAHLTS